MPEVAVTERKSPGRVPISADAKLLVGRHEAAEMLSISRRALDYLVANKHRGGSGKLNTGMGGGSRLNWPKMA